jgi:pyruvate,water dikinase
MIKAGVSVPAGYAVTTAAHRAFLATEGLDDRIVEALRAVDYGDVDSVQATSARIHGLIASTPVPAAAEAAVREAYRVLGERAGDAEVPVAVRSSAVAEDLATASFAGQLETFLWVIGADDVVHHLRQVWAGLYSPAALAYRAEMGFEAGHALMSVGVQQMVEPRAAGVMFTLNPLNGDRSKIAIEASFGLGESVVAGEVNPDRILIDKVTLEIVERAIESKDVEYRFDPSKRAVVPVPVEEERRTAPCLANEEAIEIARLGKQIERYHGNPRDVEWAIAGDGRIAILQSRAETVWSQKRREQPVMERQESAAGYVLAELMDLAGKRTGEKR